MLALLLSGVAAAMTVTASSDVVAVFKRACLEGEVRLFADSAAELGSASLPPLVRYQVRGTEASKVFRLAGPQNGFLLVYDQNAKDGPERVCEVVARDVNLVEAAQRLGYFVPPGLRNATAQLRVRLIQWKLADPPHRLSAYRLWGPFVAVRAVSPPPSSAEHKGCK